MKTVKKIFGLLMLVLVMTSFSQCSSAQKLQKYPPVIFGETYYMHWVSGVAEGPSGINVFIELKDESIQLDSIYFRGKAAKFEVKPGNKTLFIGRFIDEPRKNTDRVISNNINEEYGNEAPVIPKTIPFELMENECVVSYKSKGKTKYYKVTNLVKKQSRDIPMSPKQNNN